MGSTHSKDPASPPPTHAATRIAIGSPTPTKRGTPTLQGVLASPGFVHILRHVAAFLPPVQAVLGLPTLCRGTAVSADLLRTVLVDRVYGHPYLAAGIYWPPVLGRRPPDHQAGGDHSSGSGAGQGGAGDVGGKQEDGKQEGGKQEGGKQEDGTQEGGKQQDGKQQDGEQTKEHSCESPQDSAADACSTPPPDSDTTTTTAAAATTAAADLAMYILVDDILSHSGIAPRAPFLPPIGAAAAAPERQTRVMLPIQTCVGRNTGCAWNRHAWSTPGASKVATIGTGARDVNVYPETSLRDLLHKHRKKRGTFLGSRRHKKDPAADKVEYVLKSMTCAQASVCVGSS